jgi:hypothetical protein
MSSLPEPLDVKTRHLAEGEAALVLMESLLLMLVEKGVLDRDEVVQSVESLVEMKRQMAAEEGGPPLSRIAAGILIGVANSLNAAPGPAAADGASGNGHARKRAAMGRAPGRSASPP